MAALTRSTLGPTGPNSAEAACALPLVLLAVTTTRTCADVVDGQGIGAARRVRDVAASRVATLPLVVEAGGVVRPRALRRGQGLRLRRAPEDHGPLGVGRGRERDLRGRGGAWWIARCASIDGIARYGTAVRNQLADGVRELLVEPDVAGSVQAQSVVWMSIAVAQRVHGEGAGRWSEGANLSGQRIVEPHQVRRALKCDARRVGGAPAGDGARHLKPPDTVAKACCRPAVARRRAGGIQGRDGVRKAFRPPWPTAPINVDHMWRAAQWPDDRILRDHVRVGGVENRHAIDAAVVFGEPDQSAVGRDAVRD